MIFAYSFSLFLKSSKFQRISKQFEYENLGMRACNDKEATSSLKIPRKCLIWIFTPKNCKNSPLFEYRRLKPKVGILHRKLNFFDDVTFNHNFQPLCNIMSHGWKILDYNYLWKMNFVSGVKQGRRNHFLSVIH